MLIGPLGQTSSIGHQAGGAINGAHVGLQQGPQLGLGGALQLLSQPVFDGAGARRELLDPHRAVFAEDQTPLLDVVVVGGQGAGQVHPLGFGPQPQHRTALQLGGQVAPGVDRIEVSPPPRDLQGHQGPLEDRKIRQLGVRLIGEGAPGHQGQVDLLPLGSQRRQQHQGPIEGVAPSVGQDLTEGPRRLGLQREPGRHQGDPLGHHPQGLIDGAFIGQGRAEPEGGAGQGGLDPIHILNSELAPPLEPAVVDARHQTPGGREGHRWRPLREGPAAEAQGAAPIVFFDLGPKTGADRFGLQVPAAGEGELDSELLHRPVQADQGPATVAAGEWAGVFFDDQVLFDHRAQPQPWELDRAVAPHQPRAFGHRLVHHQVRAEVGHSAIDAPDRQGQLGSVGSGGGPGDANLGPAVDGGAGEQTHHQVPFALSGPRLVVADPMGVEEDLELGRLTPHGQGRRRRRRQVGPGASGAGDGKN
jgi:hypothetical protein